MMWECAFHWFLDQTFQEMQCSTMALSSATKWVEERMGRRLHMFFGLRLQMSCDADQIG